MVKQERPRNTVVYHWDSPAEFAETADRQLEDWQKECNLRWTGETWAQAVRGAKAGDLKLVPAAERLLEDVLFRVDTPKTEWVASMCGAYPVVPDALCGHPDAMRRKRQACDDLSPIRIYVNTTSSASVRASDLVKRGTTYLALAMAMGQVRPVELFVTSDLGEGHNDRTAINVIRLGTAPLDLATVCNALTSVGFARGIGYSWLAKKGGSGGGWAWSVHPFDNAGRAEYIRLFKEAVGASETDLVVPPIHVHDPALRNPVEFLKRAVADYTRAQDREDN